MDFAFSVDQEELRSSARRLLAERLPDARLHALADDAEGSDPALWTELVGLGWVGLSSPEGGGTFLDEAVLLEEAGLALLPGPLLAGVIAEPALVAGGADPTRATVLAWAEPAGPLAFAGTGVTTRAVPDRDGWLLTGEKADVPDLATAEQVVVLAATPDGPALFLLPAGAGDVRVLTTTDGTRRIGSLVLDAAPATLLVAPGEVDGVLDAARRRAFAGIALESVGVASRMLATATAQAGSREQFGRVIGTYQAVSHRVADMYVRTELARSLAYRAAWCVAAVEADPASISADEVDVACAGAKAAATEAAVFAAEGAIQVLGGIGMTWEHIAHRFYKRALANQSWAGTPASHRAAVAAALLDA
jgi:alkylation response protein AidB-like acyl-CoA dehydrogenase